VAGDHADKGRGPDAQSGEDHGQNAGLVDVLLGAEAYGEGAAGGDEGGSGVAQPDAKDEADGEREDKDDIGAEGLGFPVEDEAAGEKGGDGRGRGCGHFF